MKPRLSYLICATPRTGSTLLSEMLRLTQRLGVPREYFEYLRTTGRPRQPTQYFWPCEEDGRYTPRFLRLLGHPVLQFDARRLAEYRHGRYQHYLARVLRLGTTENGVFGARIMWGHMSDFMELLSGDPDVSSSGRVHRCLDSAFPALRYIFVTREDKLRQAISLWKAIQTQQWRQDTGVTPQLTWRTAVFDFEAIDYLRRRMIAHESCWRSYFDALGLHALTMHYEEFAVDLKTAFDRIRRFLGAQSDGVREASECSTPTMVRQSDAQTEEWLKLFVEEKEARESTIRKRDPQCAPDDTSDHKFAQPEAAAPALEGVSG